MDFALLALAIGCLSQPANMIRWARAPAEVLGFWRLAIAVLALAPLAWARRAAWARVPQGDAGLTALAGALFFVHLWTFVYAAQHTTIAACMLTFSTHPLWTGAGARLFFGERVTPRLLLAYALAGAGVWLLFSAGAALGRESLRGDAAGVLSALTFSGYVLAGRRARRSLDNVSFAALAYVVAAALFLAAGTARGTPWLSYPGSTWLAILGLAFVVTLGGHALFTHLLATLDVHLLSCAKLLEPPLAALGARLAFGERLTPATALAFALISAAVLALATAPAGSPTPE
jgi:drug/metabolite transporter (DMT)-like permease